MFRVDSHPLDAIKPPVDFTPAQIDLIERANLTRNVDAIIWRAVLERLFTKELLFKYCHEQPWTNVASFTRLEVSFATLLVNAAIARHRDVQTKVANIRRMLRNGGSKCQ